MKSLNLFVLLAVCGLSLTACNKKKSLTDLFEGESFFYDDFSRADGSMGDDWELYLYSVATLNIVSERVHFVTGSGYTDSFATYKTAVPSAAYIASVKFSIDGGNLAPTHGDKFLIGNMNSTSIASVTDYIICGFYGGVDNIRIVTSNSSIVASGVATFDPDDGKDFTITMQNDGANGITCTATDGTTSESISGTLSSPESGSYVGFGGGNGAGNGDYLYADDFVILEQ